MLRGETPVDPRPCIDRFGEPAVAVIDAGTAGTVPQAARKRAVRGGPAGKARRTETGPRPGPKGPPAPAKAAFRRPLPEAVPPPAESGPEGHSRPPAMETGQGRRCRGKGRRKAARKGGVPFRDSPP
ncbi:MAG: hypothetical protein ACLT2T_12380 [Bilophila wadsworthia]